MKIAAAAIGTIIFSLVVPAVVAGILPAFIAPVSPSASIWVTLPAWLLVGMGTLGYLWCAFDFVRYGLGTPAPVAAPDQLVVRGLYQYTRNPMYLSVLLIVLGQAALRWSVGVLVYAAIVFLAVNIFIRTYEEPTLTRKFGESYLRYRREVPRWLSL